MPMIASVPALARPLTAHWSAWPGASPGCPLPSDGCCCGASWLDLTRELLALLAISGRSGIRVDAHRVDGAVRAAATGEAPNGPDRVFRSKVDHTRAGAYQRRALDDGPATRAGGLSPGGADAARLGP